MSIFFFFKQKTAYEMRISDWSSDVCSSDLLPRHPWPALAGGRWQGNALALQGRQRSLCQTGVGFSVLRQCRWQGGDLGAALRTASGIAGRRIRPVAEHRQGAGALAFG